MICSKKLLTVIVVVVFSCVFAGCDKTASMFNFLKIDPGGVQGFVKAGITYGTYYTHQHSTIVKLTGYATTETSNYNGRIIVRDAQWEQVSGPRAESFFTPGFDGYSLELYVHWSSPLTEEAVFSFTALTSAGEGRYALAIVKPNPGDLEVDAGAMQSITSPTSTVTLSGTATTTGQITACKWTQVSGPRTSATGNTAIATIAIPDALSTTVSDLTTDGIYEFQLAVNDNMGATITDNVYVLVTINANYFDIGTHRYTVKTVTRPLQDRIRAESFKQYNDSASVTVIFYSAASIPPAGTEKDYKVVSSPTGSGEVKLLVARITGTDLTSYESTGTNNVIATVNVDANGKAFIYVSRANVKRLLETEQSTVSININEF